MPPTGGLGESGVSPVSGELDTLRLTAEEATGLLERREVTAAELHRAYLDAAAERDDELHCYLRLVEEPVGDGVPIALKDVISTQGIETTAGSKILAGYVPPTSHPLELVNAWREDEPHDSLGLDEVFANAPQRDGDLFRVPPTS